MTIVDLIMGWPMWAKVVSGVIFAVWLIETIVLPFKINMYVNTLKRVEGLLEQIKGRIEIKKENDTDYQKAMELMQTVLGRGKKQ